MKKTKQAKPTQINAQVSEQIQKIKVENEAFQNDVKHNFLKGITEVRKGFDEVANEFQSQTILTMTVGIIAIAALGGLLILKTRIDALEE